VEILFLLLVLAGVVSFVNSLFKGNSNSQSQSSDRRTGSTRPSPPRATPPEGPKNTFRPKQKESGRPKINFGEAEIGRGSSDPNKLGSLDGLLDAFTGEPLQSRLGLHFCKNCKVYYHTESFEVIRDENGGQCVACSSRNIVALTPSTEAKPKGRNYDPEIITLSNYKEHVGRVITFEGRVVKVLTSRRGTDYAVMFENKSWRFGFKLVFFRKAVEKVGGGRYINSLEGRNLRARGLLVKDDTFGYEIIITERSMLLEVGK
jgi:hypothetical protein